MSNLSLLSELTKRIRAMTLTLLPLEVQSSSINDPTSRIITPQVISAYKAAAGDFTEAVSLRCFSVLRLPAHNAMQIASILPFESSSAVYARCQS